MLASLTSSLNGTKFTSASFFPLRELPNLSTLKKIGVVCLGIFALSYGIRDIDLIEDLLQDLKNKKVPDLKERLEQCVRGKLFCQQDNTPLLSSCPNSLFCHNLNQICEDSARYFERLASKISVLEEMTNLLKTGNNSFAHLFL